MKKFLGNIFKKGEKQQKTGFEIINKSGDCLLHNTAAFPDVKANHHCHTCNINMCYICSNKHFENNCDITWTNKDLQVETLDNKNKLFNQGYLTKLTLEKLQCPCGSYIDQERPGSGMCVACGTATCSHECHQKYVEEEHQCTFNNNFSKEMKGRGMRSLLFKNISIMKKKGYSDFTQITKTSPHFITGLLTEKLSEIYLLRGFRQYGNPVNETLQNMEVIAQKNLDYVLNVSRACDCECSTCSNKDVHPFYNCEVDCKKREAVLFTDISQDERMQNVCDCDCSFCSSGVTVLKHRKLDCMFFCEYSTFNYNQVK
ncbi:hypothetical protein PPERSA_12284 [Pseudocohnilembus persalinus]|uniref:Uncharacterized protein n=1 Tax=Pseudocohnilembus persalinus TaxID=266149 RepID=A0A0V0R5P1_PSEPJ|nr:hypothetical protein PPERSA_12284 [Pseudocohnilembus persalinus]|eukprot:KRX09541.1 hypothetical protein PPERSA_12284 [Pseudocohnilembus persalinus]